MSSKLSGKLRINFSRMNFPISKFLNFKNIFFEFLAIKKNEDAKYPLTLGFLKIFSESLLKLDFFHELKN